MKIFSRIVFTSWYYVRPGGYAWKDDKGEVVSVTRTRLVGPWEAHYERKWDTPQGVRLVAAGHLAVDDERPLSGWVELALGSLEHVLAGSAEDDTCAFLEEAHRLLLAQRLAQHVLADDVAVGDDTGAQIAEHTDARQPACGDFRCIGVDRPHFLDGEQAHARHRNQQERDDRDDL